LSLAVASTCIAALLNVDSACIANCRAVVSAVTAAWRLTVSTAMAAFLAAASATSPASLNDASAAIPAVLAVASIAMAAVLAVASAASPATLDAPSPEIANPLLNISPSSLPPKLLSADALELASLLIEPWTPDIALARVDISLTKPLLFNSICSMVEIMPSLPSSKAALKVLIRSCNAVALVSKFEIEDAWASCLSIRSWILPSPVSS